MNIKTICLISAGTFALLGGSSPLIAAEKIVRASAGGAHLDSDLLKGGGTDNTAVLQRLLDRAAGGRPTHLIIDGVALVSGLNVHGNTTVECTAGAGLYLKNGSNRAIIRNANRSKDMIKDEHIVLRGCFLNGNRDGQRGKSSGFVANEEADGSWMAGTQFFGVNDLIIENVTILNTVSFGAHFSNAMHIDIKNVTVDHGRSSDDINIAQAGTDGLHFSGGIRYVTISGAKFRTGDDGLALDADDFADGGFGPYVRLGPITDVSASNIVVIDTISAVRVVSSKERVDRIVIDNVTGTINGMWAVGISHFLPPAPGNIGSIIISNMNVNRSDKAATLNSEMAELLKKPVGSSARVEFNNGIYPLINVNGHIENLTLRNIVTKASNDRPIIRIGPDSDIQMLTVDLSINDPALQSTPLRLDKGSKIGHLNLALDWKGRSFDQGGNPIDNAGGAIGRLNWINTPPMYVKAALRDANNVVATFSQEVKATDFKAGVGIKVNGKPVSIAGVVYDKAHPNEVQYRLGSAVPLGSQLSWAYEASGGTIRNWSGSDLLSVAEKVVAAD